MKFFIDTADVGEIRKAVDLGLVDGVTTNPSLIAKSGRDFRDVINEITALVDGPISAEVIATDAAGMVREGQELAKIHPRNIVIKVPMTEEGLKATHIFYAEGIKTNVTLVFSPLQALLAAKAGATYVSPFVGRLDDVGHDGMEGIDDIRSIFDNYGYSTEIIVASVRSPLHVLRAALIGADICTIPYNVIVQLCKHPLTDVGVQKFLADWGKAGI
ncbi:fructose-6-phosphate aldolase [Geoalkalibacter halelectricus]|uniref:Probable transaldolase n=1 Tax=Geoalkalibacter halelectricus TaxID=2847045 RepID=A0ABY5ZFI4_9BACT|nr:fructose-6-phosphate aldolase [Geoalkalibacter halelectricus]MDO3377927.1 fructose-6-phosphate aldolase [Geoalkalibacter halelectricus]UWZ77892.1 fructose-6-phosphate aldolase [Geoalkalibacter halelectricus]